MVRDFQKVIGIEARAQILKAEGKLPTAIIACVGGGSNAIGIFYQFLKDKKVKLIGVEAGGRSEKLGEHAARFRGGSPGVSKARTPTSCKTQPDKSLSPIPFQPDSIMPSIGPEHAWMHDTGRARIRPGVRCRSATQLAPARRTEGIIPALESAHAVAEAISAPRK